MGTRVLLVGQGLFRDGLAHLLGKEPSVFVVGSASSWGEAEDLIAETQPEVLIVDQAVIGGRTPDVYSLLGSPSRRLRIIHLTLDENRAVVDDLRQVPNMDATELLGMLRSSSEEPTEGAASRP